MSLKTLRNALLFSASALLPLASAVTWNPTWAGVMQRQENGSPFNFIEATLVMPDIYIPDYPPYDNALYGAAMWVGFDGWNQGDNTRLWQSGVRMRINTSGDKFYAGWWEWYPELSWEPVNWPVGPGDHIYINITTWNNGYNGYTSLTNLRTGQTIQHQQPAYDGWRSMGTTADFIFEQPTDSNWDPYAYPSHSTAWFINARACREDGSCETPGGSNMEVVDINKGNYAYTNSQVRNDGSVSICYAYGS